MDCSLNLQQLSGCKLTLFLFIFGFIGEVIANVNQNHVLQVTWLSWERHWGCDGLGGGYAFRR